MTQSPPKDVTCTASSLTRLNLRILRSHKIQIIACGDMMKTLGLWPNTGQHVRNTRPSPRNLGLPTLWNSDWSPSERVIASQQHFPNKCTPGLWLKLGFILEASLYRVWSEVEKHVCLSHSSQGARSPWHNQVVSGMALGRQLGTLRCLPGLGLHSLLGNP